MLEVFEDQAPLAARQLLNRCREGTRETLHNTHVHRLITDQGIFFGKSPGCGTQPTKTLVPTVWQTVYSSSWSLSHMCPAKSGMRR